MSIAIGVDEAYEDEVSDASEAGPAPKRIVVGFGFWIFLLSDIVMFSALFASYAVLAKATAGSLGPYVATGRFSFAHRSRKPIFAVGPREVGHGSPMRA